MRRTVILFGAGASRGSVDVKPELPPLGNELFQRMCKLNGVAASIPDELALVFRRNFEEGMATFANPISTTTADFQREMAECLIQYTPGPDNTYIKLINAIGLDGVTYSSLNYDLLLELSAARLRINCDYSHKTSQGCLDIKKIHGSCNFWPDVPPTFGEGNFFVSCQEAVSSSSTQILNRPKAIEMSKNSRGIAPVMANFEKGKRTISNSHYVASQYNSWTDRISTADNIVIIGVAVNLADEHIWNPLETCIGNVHYFGRTSDQGFFDEWQKSRDRNSRKSFFYNKDFDLSVSEIYKIHFGSFVKTKNV